MGATWLPRLWFARRTCSSASRSAALDAATRGILLTSPHRNIPNEIHFTPFARQRNRSFNDWVAAPEVTNHRTGKIRIPDTSLTCSRRNRWSHYHVVSMAWLHLFKQDLRRRRLCGKLRRFLQSKDANVTVEQRGLTVCTGRTAGQGTTSILPSVKRQSSHTPLSLQALWDASS